MRILFFLQALRHGGPERSVSYLVNGLAQRGHRLAIAALHATESGWEDILDPQKLPITVFFHETPRGALSAAYQLVASTRKLRRLLQAERIGCICCTAGSVAPVVGWLASRRLDDVRLAWHLRGTPTRSPSERSWRLRLLRTFGRWVSPTVPLLISSSVATQAAAEAAGYRCKRLVVIHNAVDAELFRPDASARAAIRSEWGISSDKKLVGLVGRLDPIKGHALFLEAAKIMAAQREDLHFVCVGDGPESYRSRLQQLGADLGLGERLLWAGGRPYTAMPAIFNALDALCLTSRNEGFPNVLMEAMACGIPCVATRVGGVPEVLGDVGITVPPGDPVALAGSVMTALLAEPRPDVMRRHVVEHFSVEAMVAAMERELQALMG
jgi:glycosyltransferase involved in cell wall biosynthesis